MLIKMEEFDKLLDKLPPLSPTAMKILQITGDPNSSADNLNRVISIDPVLAARVLKIVNSVYFALSQELTSIVRSIVILGFNTIKNLAMSAAILDTFKDVKSDKFSMNDFWRHSIGTATVSKLLARELKVDPKKIEEYFICGLLHDIGKLIFLKFYQDDFLKAVSESESAGIDLSEAEQKIIGLDHLNAGKMLAVKWKLGPNMVEAVSCHDRITGEQDLYSRPSNLVFIADLIARSEGIGFSGNHFFPLNIDEHFTKMGITTDLIISFSEKLQGELTKAEEFLKTAFQGR
ncbi:MAG: HDOD domain-containing protein [Candidatus Wallbacteria bacterium]|nr:HDOD domain-containing protein [Candidatus Wallbacteria bacterium]